MIVEVAVVVAVSITTCQYCSDWYGTQNEQLLHMSENIFCTKQRTQNNATITHIEHNHNDNIIAVAVIIVACIVHDHYNIVIVLIVIVMVVVVNIMSS